MTHEQLLTAVWGQDYAQDTEVFAGFSSIPCGKAGDRSVSSRIDQTLSGSRLCTDHCPGRDNGPARVGKIRDPNESIARLFLFSLT
jgi:hypothetical protein